MPAAEDRNETTGRTWRIEITRTAERQITNWSRSGQRFLRERLLSSENPRRWGKPLHGEKRRLWRYRMGENRLICDIQDERLLVLLLEVGHRKDNYR